MLRKMFIEYFKGTIQRCPTAKFSKAIRAREACVFLTSQTNSSPARQCDGYFKWSRRQKAYNA